jgi:plasmid stabilization system protein ParE
MEEIPRKNVRISERSNLDINSLYAYGEVMFGQNAAKDFISDIFKRIRNLDNSYLMHPECRFLATKNKRYRNIILETYLIIYRINPDSVDVLRIIHSHSSISKIRSVRRIKI